MTREIQCGPADKDEDALQAMNEARKLPGRSEGKLKDGGGEEEKDIEPA